jgi:chromosome segregation ATPase
MKLEEILNPMTVQSMLAIQKQMEAITKSMEPALKLRRQFEAMAIPYLDVIERIRTQSQTFFKGLEGIRKQNEVFSNAIRKLQLQTRSIDDALANIRKQAQPYARALEQIREISQSLSVRLTPLTFGEAYAEILSRHSAISLTHTGDPIEAVVSEVQEEVKKAPRGPLSLEFYLNVILALFLFIWAQISAIESEERISVKLQELEMIVVESISELQAYQDEYTFYVVLRAVNLRAQPTTKSGRLEVLYPNLKVRLLERKAKWIRVEYYDHRENVHKSGWVYKKYLKILNPRGKKS